MSDGADDVLAAVEDFKNFFRCGGLMLPESLVLWRTLSPEERAAFVEAAEQLEAERAALLAVAILSPEGAARVFSKVDGGDALVRQSLVNAVAKAVVK